MGRNRNGVSVVESILSWVNTLNAGSLALVVSAVTLLILMTQIFKLSTINRKIEKDNDKLEKRLRIITSGAVGMGEKLVQLEKQLAEAANGHWQVAESEAQYSYTQALKLIESGVDHSVILSNSGLSEAEVNLMELLHQSKHLNVG